MSQPKRMGSTYKGKIDDESGWWFKDPNNGNFITGPYQNKKEADEARKDMLNNYKIHWRKISAIMLED